LETGLGSAFSFIVSERSQAAEHLRLDFLPELLVPVRQGIGSPLDQGAGAGDLVEQRGQLTPAEAYRCPADRISPPCVRYDELPSGGTTVGFSSRTDVSGPGRDGYDEGQPIDKYG